MAGVKPKDFPVAGAGMVFDDTYLHVQEPGGGNSPQDVKFPATYLRDYILADSGIRLAEVTVAPATSVTVAMLTGEVAVVFRFLSPSSATVRVGTSVNGQQVIEDEPLAANTYLSIARNWVANSNETLHITGLPTGATVKILIMT